MKHIFVFLVNLTFVLGHFEFVLLSPGTQIWLISNGDFPTRKMLEAPENIDFQEGFAYVILRIVTEINLPTETESDANNHFTSMATIHYYIGLLFPYEARETVVKYVTEFYEKISFELDNVKIFRERYELHTKIFKNMFPRFTGILKVYPFKRTTLFEVKSSRRNEALSIRQISTSFKIPENDAVYICFKNSILFIYDMQTAIHNERLQLKMAVKNLYDLFIYNHGNIEVRKYSPQTHSLFELVNGGGNMSYSNEVYKFNQHDAHTITENSLQILEVRKNGEFKVVEIFNSHEINSEKCYLCTDSEFSVAFVYIGQKCKTKQIEKVLSAIEERSFSNYEVVIVQKEMLPASFIIFFKDIVNILGNEYNNPEEMVDRIATMLKLRP